MNDAQIKYAIKLECERRYEEGCRKLGLEVYPLIVNFTIKGQVAGKASRVEKKVNFNLDIARTNYAQFIQRTPVHEVAHILTRQKYGARAQSHGREWKYVMSNIFGKTPDRCHSYDMSDVPTKKLNRYPYKCSCQTFELTTIRHNRIVRGEQIYRCPKCRSILKRA